MVPDEENMRKILCFLSERFTELQDGLYTHKTIAENCNIDDAKAKQLCTLLEKEGLVESSKDQEKGDSYKITIDGMILLESYSTSKSLGSGIEISKFTKTVKRGLDRIQMRNLELQTGVIEVGQKHNLKDGLYYVVLIDLAGSTIASSRMGGVTFAEWIKKFIQITKDALDTKNRNLAVFVKSIGDGALFLFRNFDDILDWKNRVDKLCSIHNDSCKKTGKHDCYQYNYKTILHMGEIYFDRKNFDANAFGVNLIFKIEKKFGKNDIGITDAVKHIILNEINCGKFNIIKADSYSVDEKGDVVLSLWKLIPAVQSI